RAVGAEGSCGVEWGGSETARPLSFVKLTPAMPRSSRRSALCWCVRALSGCALLLSALPASADICKYIDRDGNLHYTNVAPEKGWKKLSCGVGGTGSSGGSRAPSPAGFPQVGASAQKGRGDMGGKGMTSAG